MSAYQTLIPLNFLAVGLAPRWARGPLAGRTMAEHRVLALGHAGREPVGGYLIGLLLALVRRRIRNGRPGCVWAPSPALGGPTTLSTFSAETVAMLERGAYGSALLCRHQPGRFAAADGAGLATAALLR